MGEQKSGKVEVAWQAWGKGDRLVSKRKTVPAAKLAAFLDQLAEEGARDVRTRAAE